MGPGPQLTLIHLCLFLLPSLVCPTSPRCSLHPLEADRLLLGRLPHCPEGGGNLWDHIHEAKCQKCGKSEGALHTRTTEEKGHVNLTPRELPEVTCLV